MQRGEERAETHQQDRRASQGKKVILGDGETTRRMTLSTKNT